MLQLLPPRRAYQGAEQVLRSDHLTLVSETVITSSLLAYQPLTSLAPPPPNRDLGRVLWDRSGNTLTLPI